MHQPIPPAVQNSVRLRRPSRGCGLVLLLAVAGCSGSGGSAPVTGADTLTLGEGGTVTTTSDGRDSLLDNDSGLSANASVGAVPETAPQFGTVELAADGSFRYVHDGSENLQDSFQYRVTDGSWVVIGSVTVTVDPVDDPPLLTDDVYGNAVGNTYLAVGRATGRAVAVQWTGSVLSNDTDPDGVLQVSDYDEVSAEGGIVTMATDGTFSYLPAVGFTGLDTFTYEASDGHDTATATVSITVTGRVWWVDRYRTEPGDGRSGRPFQDFTQLEQAGGVGSSAVIYVLAGPSDYTGGYVLEENQIVVGAGSAFAFGAIDLPAGEAPTIVNPTGFGFTLASGSELRGFEIRDTQGPGLVFHPGGFHLRPRVSDVTVSGAGQAVSFRDAELEVSLDSVESASSPTAGIEVTGCTGLFEVLGETVTRSAGAQGIVLSSDVGPGELEARFRGLVSVVGCGDKGIVITDMDGSVTFGDVTISSRGDLGIGLGTGTAAFVFGDVDIRNANDAEGHGLSIFGQSGSVRFASLDVDRVLHPNDPGSSYAVELVANSPTFQFEVTGRGLQGDGGSITDVQGAGVLVSSDGSVTLRRMSFQGTHRESILVPNARGMLVLEGCSFAGWSTGTGVDDPAIDAQGTATDFAFSVMGCDFDAAGVNTTLAPVVSVLGGAARTDVVFGGVDQIDQLRRSNTLTAIRRDGLVLAAQSGEMVADVAGTSFTTVSGRRGVEVLATLGSVSFGVDQCTFTGPFEVGVGISGTGGGADGARVFATIQQNSAAGAQRFVDLIQDSITELHALVRNNTATGLTVGVLNYSGSPAGPAELLLDGGSYTLVPGIALEPAVVVGINGSFAIDVTEVAMLGFDSPTYATVDVAASLGGGSTATLRVLENSLGDPTVAAFQAVLDAGSAGELQIAIHDHAEGTFRVNRQGGTVGVEDKDNFGVNNPGANLQETGTIGVLAPSSVPGPLGPWR